MNSNKCPGCWYCASSEGKRPCFNDESFKKNDSDITRAIKRVTREHTELMKALAKNEKA